MKFYELNDYAPRPDFKVYPAAFLAPDMQGAEFIAQGGGKAKGFFKRPENESITNTVFIDDTPVFDHFVLKENYGSSRKKFDWIKLNIYHFVTEHYNLSFCYLVSPKFKEVINGFRLPRHKFYPAKLLFKGEKLDYYIFQLGEVFKPIYEQCTYQIKNFDPTDCRYKDTGIIMSAKELKIENEDNYLESRSMYRKQEQLIEIQDCVLPSYYDYFSAYEVHKIVSAPLKEALESAGLTEGIGLIDISPRSITFLNP